MKRNLFPAILLMVPALGCGVATADVYRWTDVHGNPHFGDRPEYLSEPIEVKTADAGDPDAADPANDDATELREANCEKASKRLAEYEVADQLIGQDEYGRKHEIVGEERVELMLRVKKDVEEFCGEAAASAPEPAKPPAAEKAAAAPAEGTAVPEQESAPSADGTFGGTGLSPY